MIRERVLAAAGSSLFTALAVVTALALGAVVIVVSDDTPQLSDALDAYRALFDSSLGSSTALERTLVEATPLLFAGLSVALAFRAGLFNIGGAGQLMVGASAAAGSGSPSTCRRRCTCRSPCSPGRPAGWGGPGSPGSSRPAPGPTRSSARSC